MIYKLKPKVSKISYTIICTPDYPNISLTFRLTQVLIIVRRLGAYFLTGCVECFAKMAPTLAGTEPL